jgi:hypothetical protein
MHWPPPSGGGLEGAGARVGPFYVCRFTIYDYEKMDIDFSW